MGNCLIFDIETGPGPWAEIEPFFAPPEKPGEFNPAAVKYGNTKAEDKRAEIFAKAEAKHAEAVAGWVMTCEEAKAEFLGKAALSPLTGQILAIGYYRAADCGADGKAPAVAKIDGRPEPELLRQFWSVYHKYQSASGRIIGHNIFGFDLPFIVRRCWRHGVAVPESAIVHRGFGATFADTMTQWACGIYGERVSLDALGRYFGVGSKPDGVSGADFARLWNGTAEEKRQAEAYLRNDLELTWKVAEKVGLIV